MMDGTMWRTAIILCVAVFITARGDTPNDIDCHQAIESIDNAKELIIGHYRNVQQRAIASAKTAYANFIRYVNFLANGMNDSIKKINDEIGKLFGNSSERTKRKCKIYNDYLGGAALAVRENMQDCAKFAAWDSGENLSRAFYCLQDAKKNLKYQKRLARMCRTIDYNKVLDYAYFIINNTSANITTEYEAYINTIGDINFLDECINDKATGYKQLSNAAPIVIANTKRCIGKMPIRG